MSQQQTQTAAVETESGLVSGTGTDIRIFKGIPFAAPPVGERRWKPPAPPEKWVGVRPMVEFGADCPQPASPNGGSGSRAGRASEDCLTLNIWAPAAKSSAADVATDGEAFARKGVILVTVNYRVGLFGFLAHPALTAESPHHSSSNYALLDQLAALQWIKNNTANFGGDPNKVTLFGVSAGSASVSLLLASPLAKGLFQQAILESPGGFRPLASLGEAEEYGLKLGTDLATLRRMSVEELLAKTNLFVPKIRGLTTPRVLRPIRDGWVIPEDERDAFAAGRFHAMPIIVGSNADEGSNFVGAWPIKTVAEYRAFVTENFGSDTERALSFYPVREDSEVKRQLGHLFADTQFNYGVWALAREMTKSRQQVWRYLLTRRRPGQLDGPHHGEEVAYVFGALHQPRFGEVKKFDTTDEKLSTGIMEAWVNFARSADPNGAKAPNWPAYDAARETYLELGDTPKTGQGWRGPEMAFLDGFFERLYRRNK